MATTKVTFTLDRETVKKIKRAADHLALPKSQVVRRAVHEFFQQTVPLSDEERRERLRIFDELIAKIPIRPQKEAERELREIRASRGHGRRRARVA
jgi:hypothetical protein